MCEFTIEVGTQYVVESSEVREGQPRDDFAQATVRCAKPSCPAAPWHLAGQAWSLLASNVRRRFTTAAAPPSSGTYPNPGQSGVTSRLWSSTTADLESGAHPHPTATNHPTHHPCTPPIRLAKGSVRISLSQHHRIGSNPPFPAEAPTHTVTMAGNPPVRPLYRFMATGLGASMWFFVRWSSAERAIGTGQLTRSDSDLLPGKERRCVPPDPISRASRLETKNS